MTFQDIPDNATIRREKTGNTHYLKAYWRIQNKLNTRYIGLNGSSLSRIFKLKQIAKKTGNNLAEIINNMNLQLVSKGLDLNEDQVFDEWLDSEFLKTFGIGEKITTQKSPL